MDGWMSIHFISGAGSAFPSLLSQCKFLAKLFKTPLRRGRGGGGEPKQTQPKTLYKLKMTKIYNNCQNS